MSNNNYRLPTYYIYLITNKINGKNYIGQRRCPENKTPETDTKYMGSGIYLQKSQNKYGIENFSKEIIAICYSKEIVNILEIQYIAIFKSIGKAEYNNASGGNYGDFWNYFSEEQKEITKQKIREKRALQASISEKSKEKFKISLKNYWNSPEGLKQKQINSERQKGHKNTKGKHWFNNGIQNIVADTCPKGFVPGRLGDFTQSEETKQKRREFEKNMTKEQRKAKSEKLSKILKGHIVTEETRANISKANKGRKYYNNGVIEVMRFECPEGFVPGRVLRHK